MPILRLIVFVALVAQLPGGTLEYLEPVQLYNAEPDVRVPRVISIHWLTTFPIMDSGQVVDRYGLTFLDVIAFP